MPVENEIQALQKSTDDFIRLLEALPEDAFLAKIDSWSPRDIFAHLIGWNRLTIQGCEEIRKGEIPSFNNDPGEDFCKVNERLVNEYSSENLGVLLDQHRVAHSELLAYLQGLEADEWVRDFGVMYEGETETIQGLVSALSHDYSNHQSQIMNWLRHREA